MTLRSLPKVPVKPRISATEAAARLNVSKVHLLRLVASGHLKAERPLGDEPGKPYAFDPAEVERLRRLRDGEAGDVLDRVDITAAERDPAEDRNARIRASWLYAIETVAKRNGGTFHTGQLRSHLTDEAQGHAPGALITSLKRRKLIEDVPGAFGTLSDPRNRHSESPCKVYRVIGALS